MLICHETMSLSVRNAAPVLPFPNSLMQANGLGYPQRAAFNPPEHFHHVYCSLVCVSQFFPSSYSRDVSDLVLVLHHIHDLIRQDTRNLRRICTRHIAIQSLPLRDPGLRWLLQCDHALEDLGCAFANLFSFAAEVEELLAVWAALLVEMLRLC